MTSKRHWKVKEKQTDSEDSKTDLESTAEKSRVFAARYCNIAIEWFGTLVEEVICLFLCVLGTAVPTSHPKSKVGRPRSARPTVHPPDLSTPTVFVVGRTETEENGFKRGACGMCWNTVG